MRILICGDRRWQNFESIERVIHHLLLRYGREGLEIVEGGGGKTDLTAASICRMEQVAFHEYPAFWKLYGRAAGPIRNTRMLEAMKPDCVYAFHANLKKSKGTKDMVNQARKKGIPVVLIKK